MKAKPKAGRRKIKAVAQRLGEDSSMTTIEWGTRVTFVCTEFMQEKFGIPLVNGRKYPIEITIRRIPAKKARRT